MREGFKETFQPLIESQDAVKASIDKEQNAMIKQLQKNQKALTEGLDKNRLAITSGFDKMDEVKRWDLDQLPGFEAIEYPEKEPEEEPVEKPKSVAYFEFEDLDKGLNYKKAKDILKEFGLKRLPSEYKDESIEKINKKIAKARENLNITKIKLKDTAIPKFNTKEGFEMASPIKKRPLPKTLDLIEKHDTLRRYIYNLNNLKLLKENISPKTGQDIIHFNNPLQLFDRLELLVGSLNAGNNGVKQEFTQIAHLLHQLKVITKKQLNDLLKKYILNK